jgi:putative ABC transport system permease protein
VRLLLAVLGVAVGVGLLSAVLSQNGSTTRGAEDAYKRLAGRARVEVVARSPLGMPVSVERRVLRSRSVALAVPTVHDLVGVETGRGRFDLWLIGATSDAEQLGGAPATFARAGAERRGGGSAGGGLVVSRAIATRLGVGAGDRVTVRSRVGIRRARVGAVLPDERLGDVADAPIVAAPLALAQRLDGNPGRIQRIAVVPRGSADDTRAELRRLIGDRVADVRGADFDASAQAQASSLIRNSSSLFAALSLVVGALLAYASMSLIAAERRREVATLNALGCSSRALLVAVLAEALLVGLAGSVLGVALGRAALGGLLPAPDPLLASVFIVERTARMTPGVVALSVAAGVAATLAAAAVPARELVRVPPAEALVGEGTAAASPGRLTGSVWLVAAPIVLALAGAALSLAGQAIVGVGLLVFAGLLAIPAAVPVVARAIRARLRSPGGAPLVGITEIVAFPSRASALVAVVTLAVCGTTIIAGTASDLSTGVGRLGGSTYKGAAVFVRPDSEGNVFLTQPIDPRLRSTLERRPKVGSISEWRASFISWNGRRILAFGFDPDQRDSPSGFTRGDGRRAAKALTTDPAAVAVSSDLGGGASPRPGSRLTVPTPVGPRHVRVVANISNYGWAAGAIVFNPASLARWWGRDFVTALKLQPEPGVGPGELARGLEPVLRRRGLTASTSPAMRAQAKSNAEEQLATVSRIGSLIALAGVLAVAAAAMLGVLGRARRITSLRTIGMSSRQVASATFAELACIVLIGALVGLVLGIVGRVLAVHHLATSVSLPVDLYISWPQFVRPVVLVAVIAGVATLLAVRASLRLPLRRALDER